MAYSCQGSISISSLADFTPELSGYSINCDYNNIYKIVNKDNDTYNYFYSPEKIQISLNHYNTSLTPELYTPKENETIKTSGYTFYNKCTLFSGENFTAGHIYYTKISDGKYEKKLTYYILNDNEEYEEFLGTKFEDGITYYVKNKYENYKVQSSFKEGNIYYIKNDDGECGDISAIEGGYKVKNNNDKFEKITITEFQKDGTYYIKEDEWEDYDKKSETDVSLSDGAVFYHASEKDIKDEYILIKVTDTDNFNSFAKYYTFFELIIQYLIKDRYYKNNNIVISSEIDNVENKFNYQNDEDFLVLNEFNSSEASTNNIENSYTYNISDCFGREISNYEKDKIEENSITDDKISIINFLNSVQQNSSSDGCQLIRIIAYVKNEKAAVLNLNFNYNIDFEMATLTVDLDGIKQSMGTAATVFDNTGLKIYNGNFSIYSHPYDEIDENGMYNNQDDRLLYFNKENKEYKKFTGNEFKEGITYYIKNDDGYIATDDKKPQDKTEYYYIITAAELHIKGNGSFTGEITAESGSFNGQITANSGSIGGFDIKNNTLISKDEKIELCGQDENNSSYIKADNLIIGNNARVDGSIEIGNLTILAPDTEDGTVLQLKDKQNNYFSLNNSGDITGLNWNIDNTGHANFLDVDVVGTISASVIDTSVFRIAKIQSLGGKYIYRPSEKIKDLKINWTEASDLENKNIKYYEKTDSGYNLAKVINSEGSYYYPKITFSITEELYDLCSFDINKNSNTTDVEDDSTTSIEDGNIIDVEYGYLSASTKQSQIRIINVASQSNEEDITTDPFDLKTTYYIKNDNDEYSELSEIEMISLIVGDKEISIEKDIIYCEKTIVYEVTAITKDSTFAKDSTFTSGNSCTFLFIGNDTQALITINSDGVDANGFASYGLKMSSISRNDNLQDLYFQMDTNLLLGKFDNSNNDIPRIMMGTYGLYCDNVYLKGKLVTDGEISAGIDSTLSYNFNKEIKNGEDLPTENAKIIIYAGAEGTTEDKIQSAPFQVTDTGIVYAEDAVLTNSVIANSSIRTSIIYGTGGDIPLKIYYTNDLGQSGNDEYSNTIEGIQFIKTNELLSQNGEESVSLGITYKGLYTESYDETAPKDYFVNIMTISNIYKKETSSFLKTGRQYYILDSDNNYYATSDTEMQSGVDYYYKGSLEEIYFDGDKFTVGDTNITNSKISFEKDDNDQDTSYIQYNSDKIIIKNGTSLNISNERAEFSNEVKLYDSLTINNLQYKKMNDECTAYGLYVL